MTSTKMKSSMTIGAVLVAGLTFVAAPAVAQNEREPERPLLRNVPAAELEQMLIPSFCRSDSAEARDGEGHPKFGMRWCEMLGTDQAAGGDEEGSLAKLVQFGRAFQPFCREGGAGHPEFGLNWCMRKTQSLLAGAQIRVPAGGVQLQDEGAPFCRPGGEGHPKWGIEWCTMTEDQRHALGEPGNGNGRGNESRREDGTR